MLIFKYLVLGGCCLCTGTGIFFLFSSFLWLLVTVFFLIGSLSDHFICKTLENTTTSELGQVADKYVNQLLHDNIPDLDFNISVSNVLEQCRNDETIYKIFQLDTAFNLTSQIENWQENFEIDNVIDEVKETVDKTLNDIVDKIDITEFEGQINVLSNILSEMNTTINTEIVDLNLSDFFDISKLDEIRDQINSLPPSPEVTTINATLNSVISQFDEFSGNFEEAKNNFSDYLTKDLAFEVSIDSTKK